MRVLYCDGLSKYAVRMDQIPPAADNSSLSRTGSSNSERYVFNPQPYYPSISGSCGGFSAVLVSPSSLLIALVASLSSRLCVSSIASRFPSRYLPDQVWIRRFLPNWCSARGRRYNRATRKTGLVLLHESRNVFCSILSMQ